MSSSSSSSSSSPVRLLNVLLQPSTSASSSASDQKFNNYTNYTCNKYWTSKFLDSSAMELSSWKKKRLSYPFEFLKEEQFVDFWIHCSGKTYPCHRIILAAHSEYFQRCLQIGMKEQNDGIMDLRNIDAEVFDVIHFYIYMGAFQDQLVNSIELLSDIFFAANMLQIEDLEVEVLRKILRSLTPLNCLEIKAKLNKIFTVFTNERMVEHIKEILDEFVEDCVLHHWKDLVLTPGFLELSVDELCEVLELKSSQEELSDFSHSFTQNDLVLGISVWLEHDLENRFYLIRPKLSSYFCLHQATQQGNRLLFIYLNIYENLINGTFKLPKNSTWFKYDTKKKSNEETIHLFCEGRLCPHKLYEGLIIVSTILKFPSPSKMMYYFYTPKVGLNACWDQNKLIFKDDQIYQLKDTQAFPKNAVQFLLPNNHLTAVTKTSPNPYRCLLFNKKLLNEVTIKQREYGDLSTAAIDSNIAICDCKFNHWSICWNFKGTVYVVATCPMFTKKLQFSPDTCFVEFLQAPFLTFGTSTCYVNEVDKENGEENDTIYAIGGYVCDSPQVLSGVDIVICTYTVPDLESGFGIHNILTTEVITCGTVPYPRSEISKYSQKKDSWQDIPDVSLPFSTCDASIVQVIDDIFVIGGFTLKNDVSRNLHYFEPQISFWKLNLKTNKWCQGPDLPVLDDLIGFAKGTTYLLDDGCQIIYSGGVQLKINSNKNQIYEYVTNTKVFLLNLQEENWEWKTILDLSEVGRVLPDFTVYAILPAKVALPKFCIRDKKLDSMAIKSQDQYHDELL